MDEKVKYVLKIFTPAIFVFAIFTAFFTNRKTPTVPCANNLSCEESLDLQIDNEDVAVFDGNHVYLCPENHNGDT